MYRCLVVTELFLPTRGGTAVWFDEVYRRLGGKEIHIVTADVPGSMEHDISHPNTVHRLTWRRYWWLRPESLAIYLALFWKCLSVCRQHDIDFVHAGRVLPEGLVAWLVAFLSKKPCAIYAHGEEITTWTQPIKRKVLRWTYCHADKVIANSEFTGHKLTVLGITSERVEIIHPGVDLERFRPGLRNEDLRKVISVSGEEKVLFSVGRLSRRKGFDQVIRALPWLEEHGLACHYAIAGIGEDEEYLRALVEELGLGDRVHLLGEIGTEELPRWYNAADLYVMPNREIDGDTEGFGMVYIEAAACGKPSICGLAGGTGSAVVDGVTGLRVDGENTKRIAEGISWLLSDSDRLDEMGKIACRRARSEFSWDRVARKTLELTMEQIST